MLQEQDRTRLDSIVNQMVTNKESDADIQAVVNDFKSKYETTPGPVSSPAGGSILKTASDIVGTTGLARGITSVLAPDQTSDINRISESAGKFTEMANKLPVGDPRRERLLQLAKQTSGEAKTLSEENISSIPTNKEVLGSAAQTGLTIGTLGSLSPVGKLGNVAKTLIGGGKVASVAKGAVLGAGFGAAGALEANQTPTTGDIATGAVVGGALPIVGAGLEKLGNFVTENLPKRIVDIYLSPSKNISEYVIKNTKLGPTKKMLNESQDNIKIFSGNLNDILSPINEKVKTSKILTSVAQSYGQAGGGGTITGNEVKNILKKTVPGVKGLLSRDELTFKELNKVGIEVNRELGDRFFTAKHSAFAKEVTGTFNEFSRDLIKKKAPATIPIYDNLSKEITLRNALNKITKRTGRIGLGDLIGAAIGSLVSPLGTIPGIIAERFLRSPATGIGVAKTLTKLGQVPIPQTVKQFTKIGALRGTTAQ